jgi:hypothetical protein
MLGGNARLIGPGRIASRRQRLSAVHIADEPSPLLVINHEANCNPRSISQATKYLCLKVTTICHKLEPAYSSTYLPTNLYFLIMNYYVRTPLIIIQFHTVSSQTRKYQILAGRLFHGSGVQKH